MEAMGHELVVEAMGHEHVVEAIVSYPDPNVRNDDYRLQYNITYRGVQYLGSGPDLVGPVRRRWFCEKILEHRVLFLVLSPNPHRGFLVFSGHPEANL